MEEDLKVLIQKAVEVLKSFGATEVYLFGSVAKGTYDSDSDIDLAVSGIAPENFFKAMGGVIGSIKREIDLVDLDESGSFAEYIKSHGELKRVA